MAGMLAFATWVGCCCFMGLRFTAITPICPLIRSLYPTAVVEVVRCIGGASVSHVVDVFRGNNTVGVRKAGHGAVPVHGCGRAFCRNNGEAERLVRRMVVSEEGHRSSGGRRWGRGRLRLGAQCRLACWLVEGEQGERLA